MAVHAREELYHGAAVAGAPDVITLCGPGYQVLVPHEIALYDQGAPAGLFAGHKWSGRHEQYGVFALAGPGIAAGVTLADADMPDVTPTLLYALGEAATSDMDGRVQTQAFTAQTPGRPAHRRSRGRHRRRRRHGRRRRRRSHGRRVVGFGVYVK